LILPAEWSLFLEQLQNFESAAFAAYSLEEISKDHLDASAQAILNDFKAAPRRHSWLLGRAALYNLSSISKLNFNEIALTKFPSPIISLSHTDALAVAVACPAGAQLGVGLDVQSHREIPLKSLRLFLTSNELKSFEGFQEEDKQQKALLIWTQKEAVFKATPQNDNVLLSAFELNDLGSLENNASFLAGGLSYRVKSWIFSKVTISVAFCVGDKVL